MHNVELDLLVCPLVLVFIVLLKSKVNVMGSKNKLTDLTWNDPVANSTPTVHCE